MLNKKPLSLAVQRALYGAAVATVAAGGSVYAQDEGSDGTVLEEITVTGSRIAIDANLNTTSPVMTIRTDEIVNRGITRVEDIINDMPQIVPELTANESNGATGTATLDLRGLGSERTLVLTNGHRMGFGDPFALAPDINQIPGNLVERIELLTGGASSVYGADAVAGVVNFVMKTDYEGFEISWQRSGYSHDNSNGAVRDALTASGFEAPGSTFTGGETNDISVIMGANSGDGRGNVTAYLGYRDINEIRQGELDFSACALSASATIGCGGSATLPTGFFSPFDGVQYFTVQGDQFVPWDYQYYNYAPLNHFQRPDERFTAGLFGHYEYSAGHEAYTEVMFMDDHSLAQIAPSGAFFVTDTISCANFFLSAQQFATLGCTAPTDVVPWYIGRRNVEGGPRFDDARHTNMRTLLGFRGEINDSWSYDVSANISRLRFSEVYNNDLSITRIVRALNVVDDGAGNPACVSALSGVDPNCVPWNVFQTDGVTQAAIDYLTLPLFSKADMEQDQYVAFIQGDLTDAGIVLPTASDGVQVVFGLEHREESIVYEPDTGFTSGDGAGQGGPIPATTGSIRVDELFTEAHIPLVQDRTGFQSLSLDLRYRYSDYDLGFTTDTWNVGGEWRPVDALMIRGGVSTAVRAPNISELFEPQSLGLWSGTDPCATATPELSAAECANTGVTAAQYGTVPKSPADQYNALFGGNPQLTPEESDSVTIGAVFTPSGGALDGLTLSLDYWSFEIEDVISAGLGEEFTIRQCASTGDPTFCNLITRGPNGNLWIGTVQGVQSTNVNIGSTELDGFDFTGSYGFGIGGYGDLDLSYRGTFVHTDDPTPIPGEEVIDCVGFFAGDCGRPRPEYKHTLTTSWGTPWDFDFSLGWRTVGEVKDKNSNGADYTADTQHYVDIAGSYTADWFGSTTRISVGVTNVADNEAPVSGTFNEVAVYGNGNTIPGTWDALGRYWFVALNVAL